MKKVLLLQVSMCLCCSWLNAQVTRINNNKSLQPISLLNNNLALAVSATDQTLWATNGTLAGTIQLSTTIKVMGYGNLLNGKYIFEGSTPATGSELYITDGTPGGTVLLADIVPGATGSEPTDNFILMNGFLYFSAATPAAGREPWRTNGTAAGTTLVRDVFPGPTGSNEQDKYEFVNAGNKILFAASGSATSGVELWRSDGTTVGTVMVKDINGGNLPSNPHLFYNYKNMTFFAATTAASGEEIWKTDGTELSTVMLREINPGASSATAVQLEVAPGFFIPFNIFYSFHEFNGNLYFTATNGAGGGIWRTDGSTANTTLVRQMTTDLSSINIGFALFYDAFNLPNKFIFPYAEFGTKAELWQSDGTTGGTQLFQSFPVTTQDDYPLIYVNIDYDAGTQTLRYPLYNGKFFFTGTTANGTELWMTDGTNANTSVVKDINPSGSGIDQDNSSYLYTTSGLYYAGNDGVTGNELWKTNATSAGTTLVQDINPNAEDARPVLYFIVNGKILFTATDGDDANNTDLFVVDGNFIPLPISLAQFDAIAEGDDALLNWITAEERDTKFFTVQSSDNTVDWKDLGIVQAKGNTSAKTTYSYRDAGVMKRGQQIIYYRLVTTDMNGQTSLSKIVSLKTTGANWDVHLLENPVMDKPALMIAGAEGIVYVVINDMSGKTVYRQKMAQANGRISVPVNLTSGTFIITVTDNKSKKTIKMVKR